jgi:hypothetical protein
VNLNVNLTCVTRLAHRTAAALLVLLLVSGCTGYGGTTSGEDNPGIVKSDGEYCELDLPDGWTWFPAQWAAESPNGTRMSFEDALYGRPKDAEWDEVIEKKIATVRESNPEATITETDTRLTIDYGAEAGLAVVQRFDRVGCQVTFSNARTTRATEFEQWQGIIDSMRRISPDPSFTPPAAP